MRILICSPEAVPFFKTGGLGDVAGALARALARRGHDCRLVLPRYRTVDTNGRATVEAMPSIEASLGGEIVAGAVDRVGGEAPAYLVRCGRYYDRSSAYGVIVDGRFVDYADNLDRFAFFCLVSLWMLKGLGWRPDIIHCNDWQTALIPVYLRRHAQISADPFFRDIRTVYSIHNLAFQGRTSPDSLKRLGLGADLMDLDAMEYKSGINLMKGGVVFSDCLTTVSPTYAREIQTPDLGCGLDGLLRTHAARLVGILNGIDVEEWDPGADPHLEANYDHDDLSGKAECKRALQEEFGLPVLPDAPLAGMVTRLSVQKGLELVDACVGRMVEMGFQLVALGSGEPRYHHMIERWRRRYPRNVGARLEFDLPCSHRIEAGADLFLMPSYYEPCGLNQMYSMRYGAPPIVRRTGGLADSVRAFSPYVTTTPPATGFVFERFSPGDLLAQLELARTIYREAPERWEDIMRAGMREDFSWDAAAAQYEQVYELAATAPQTVAAPRGAALPADVESEEPAPGPT